MGTLDLIKLVFPLLLISLMLGGVWYFVNKKKVVNNFTKFKSLPIDIINIKTILPKKYIAAVKVENKILILGVTDNSVNLLQEKDFDESYLNTNLNTDVKSKFQEILKNSWPGR